MTQIPSKVSIIVPVYNVENYLTKCLGSLVGQSLQNIEIIVVNDGSKDRSEEIIQQYARDYPEKIKAFNKENGGLSDARNFGIDKATGDYIGFVDSDDYVTEMMFEEMLLLAEKHQAKMVICNIRKVDENGKVTQNLTQLPNMPEKIILENNFSVFADISYFACNKLFKKNFLLRKDLRKAFILKIYSSFLSFCLSVMRLRRPRTIIISISSGQIPLPELIQRKGLICLRR